MKDCPVIQDIPIPINHRGRVMRFPFHVLNIGQCFFVAGMDRNTMSSYCNYAAKKFNTRYTSKKYSLNGKRGVMVWRTA